MGACTAQVDIGDGPTMMKMCVMSLLHPAARGPPQSHHSHCSHGPDGHLPDGGSRQPALGGGTRHGGECDKSDVAPCALWGDAPFCSPDAFHQTSFTALVCQLSWVCSNHIVTCMVSFALLPAAAAVTAAWGAASCTADQCLLCIQRRRLSWDGKGECPGGGVG